MAEECISVYFETTGTTWDYCWEDATPDPGWKPENVCTGLRKSQGATPRAWRTCQYYMKCMSAICKWWKEGTPQDESGTTTSGSFYCSFRAQNTSDNPNDPDAEWPTGFNYGRCDFLGRRHWCDKYESGGDEDLEQWICVAPNPYLTGLGQKDVTGERAILEPYPREDIWGYNMLNDGTGTGICDCHGFGRGELGCDISQPGPDATSEELSNIEELLNELPIQCNLYRPYQMGFGIIDPAPKETGDVLADGTITDKGWDNVNEWEDQHPFRLPLNYEVYNTRARFQKCQWWKESSSIPYLVDEYGLIYLKGAPSLTEPNDVFDSTGRVLACENTDTAVLEYNTRIWETASAEGGIWETVGAQFALDGVWAGAGGPVCNGCRPDCPGYSGKWVYLTNDKMLPGMPMTANQILELRFWSAAWESKEAYDEYYEQKPNFDDESTSAIYTFTRWQHDDRESDPELSIMLGKKLDLCLPAPVNNREFTEDYIIEEQVEYYQVETIGTSSSDQRHYPSLIRVPNFPDLGPLEVLYPYYNDGIYDADICVDQGNPGHIKRHNTIYGDHIRAVGHTNNDCKVFVINTEIVPVQGKLKSTSGAYAVKSASERYKLFDIITDTILTGQKDFPEYVVSVLSDPDFGYFITPGVKLEYGKKNNLLICVDYGDGAWEWRWREVNSQWCGGLLQQTSYEHVYTDDGSDSGFENTQPYEIRPTATVEMDMVTLGGARQGELKSSYSYENKKNSVIYYGWTMYWEHEGDAYQERWAPIGNSNLIFLEIEDLELNYIYEWEIEEATLTLSDPNAPEDDPRPSIIDFEVVDELEFDAYLPPSVCILKPVTGDRYRFFNSEWDLSVSYKYKKFSNEDPEDANFDEEDYIAGAQAGGGYSRYSSTPYTVAGSTITDIYRGPVSLLGEFQDTDGRVIATSATKALIGITREACRPLEIRYTYYAEAKEEVLTPESGFCIDISGIQATGVTKKIQEDPACGDHEGAYPIRWQAPLWFPFNNCRGFELYDEFTICNRCQSGYVGPENDGVVTNKGGTVTAGMGAVKRYDFRYCGPHKRKAYGKVRDARPTPCNCGCVFYFANAESATVNFSGFANLREQVDEGIYEYRGWIMPPFGNQGREFIERYLSIDYEMHFNDRGDSLKSWMPLVADHTIFYFADFDCFNTDTPEDEYYGISASYSREPFLYINQLNNYLLSNISEAVEFGGSEDLQQRYRFEDVFEVHFEGNCTYPRPAYPQGNSTKAVLYHFKEDNYAWAWQEHWKDIVRYEHDEIDQDESENVKFNFVELIRPPYRWSFYKEEKRFITEENNLLDLKYLVPNVGGGTGDGYVLLKYPELAIGLHARPFELLYDEETYTSEHKVTWVDVGGEAATGGSDAVANIYEKTMQDPWIHHEDTLYDDTATEDLDVANSIVTSVDGLTGDETKKYYNTGIIANMTRDRLYYIPKVSWELDYAAGGFDNGSFGYINVEHEARYNGNQTFPTLHNWQNESVTMYTEELEHPTCFLKLYIRGKWGSIQKRDIPFNSDETNPDNFDLMLRPAVELIVYRLDGTFGPPKSEFSSYITEALLPEDELELGKIEEYELELKFLAGPLELIDKKMTKRFDISFTGRDGYFICIDEIILTETEIAHLGNSQDRSEPIEVWERKYNVSTTSVQQNMDGPGDYIQYNVDIENSGQYFPFAGNRFQDEEFDSLQAASKMRSTACGVRYTEKESVSVNMGNLLEVESEKQKEIYNWAFDNVDGMGDKLSFSSFDSPKLQGMLESIGETARIGSNLEINSERLLWEDHRRFKQFKQYEFWRPGGHSYEWSKYWRQDRCFLFDKRHTIFEGSFRHHDHPSSGGGVDLAADILNSYYTTRQETVDAKQKRADVLGGLRNPPPRDLVSSANPYSTLQQG